MSVAGSPALDHESPLASELLRRLRVAHDVEARLFRSGYLALRGISCELHDGIARLRGHLPTYYLKQIAQEIVGEVVGVRSVVNQIEVGPRRVTTMGENCEQVKMDCSNRDGDQT